jgi:hypothetical protein
VRGLTSALIEIVQTLGLLDQQMFATCACSVFGPASRY